MPSKKSISLIIKFSIVFFTFLFLYKQLRIENNPDLDLDKIKGSISQLFISQKNILWIIFLVFMMFINWLLEALKWRYLIRKIENVSILRSLRAIFTGITVSSFTPNRIGEYGGRIFCLNKADRIQGALITVIGSMGQLLTTVFFGSLGIFFLPHLQENPYIAVSSSGYIFLGIALVTINICLVSLYLNTSFLSSLLKQFSWFSRFQKYTEVFSYYSPKELLFVFFMSIARYIIFTTQFFILFYLFKVNIPYFEAIILISTMLLIISLIPIPSIFPSAITEMPFRFIVIITLFKGLSSNFYVINDVLAATFLLWIINLILPTIIGSIFVFTLKFFRNS